MNQLFNNSQLDRLSETLSNFGLLLFASMVVPVFTGIDKVRPFAVLSGLVASFASWVLSLLLLKGVKS